MCELIVKPQVIVVVFIVSFLKNVLSLDDSLLFAVSAPPRDFGVAQNTNVKPMSVEISENYVDQDYFADNKRRHSADWNRNRVDGVAVDAVDDTDEALDDKDRDYRVMQFKEPPKPADLYHK